MNWLEISVETEAAAVETVSAILHEYGEGGVAVHQDVIPDDEDAAYHYDTSRPTVVTTYVPATAEGTERRDAIAAALGHLTAFDLARISPVRTREVAEEDWANAWKEFYHPMRFGRHLVVKPSWRDFAAGPDDLVIELDPGMAFGTGLHQTTAMCLALLEDYVRPGLMVLDQGAGSGILSLAAARLGAARVVAVDTSEVAVASTRENAARNGLEDVIVAVRGRAVPGTPDWTAGRQEPDTLHAAALQEPDALRIETRQEPDALDTAAQREPDATAATASDPALPASYDLVVANIIANVIIALAPGFATVTRPGGTLITSGIIHEREGDVRVALAAAGFSVTQREARDEWVALVATKR